MEIWRKFLQYLKLEKDKQHPDNTSIKLMHGMNKISLMMFVVAIVVLIVKCVR